MATDRKSFRFFRKFKFKYYHILVYVYVPNLVKDYAAKTGVIGLQESILIKRKNFLKRIFNIGPDKKYLVNDGATLVHVSAYYKCNRLLQQVGFGSYAAIGNCYTNPNYRGKGIYGYTLKKICAAEEERNIALVVDIANKASIKGVEKAGFAVGGEFKVTRMLGFAIRVKKLN